MLIYFVCLDSGMVLKGKKKESEVEDMARTYHLTTVRVENIIYVLQVFMDGSKVEIARFRLPNDGQWRLDVDFLDDIMDAYKKRLKKVIE